MPDQTPITITVPAERGGMPTQAEWDATLTRLATALEDTERVNGLLAENKRLNAQPTGNHYFPETRQGWDAARRP